jgi:glycosyltransferase involved in cell wall biosynthesis
MRTDRFCQQFGWPADSVVVGLTGQMTPTKGHEDFIAAAAVVTRKNPKARFVIGGKGFDEFLSIQRELVAANGLQAVVGFSGWSENVTDFFEAIDLFVLASRHDEGFGLVLAEAGERGLAAVATRSGGAAEIIVDGETGVLVEKAKPDDMAMVIEKLVAGQDLRQQMGGRARSRVIEFFDLDQQAAKIKAFLNRS